MSPQWKSRITAAVAAQFMGLGVAVAISPHMPAASPGPVATPVVDDAQLRKTNVSAAVGHITSDEAAQPCATVDAIKAETALVRYVGTVDVVRVSAAEAWTEAEASKVVVVDWCKGGAR